MKCWMLWNGGSSYAPSDQFVREHIDAFDSMADLLRDFDSRPGDPYYPVVSRIPQDEGGPSAWVCFADPYEVGDLYPDRLVSYGPRGGLRVERC